MQRPYSFLVPTSSEIKILFQQALFSSKFRVYFQLNFITIVLFNMIKSKNKKGSIWTRPTFIPEHGVLLVLFGSFLTGAALAQQWTYSTTLAFACAFFALLAEYPYIVQIKLRKRLIPLCIMVWSLWNNCFISSYFSWFSIIYPNMVIHFGYSWFNC